LKNVKLYAAQKTGSGPKKTECQDMICVLDPFSDGCYYFAVYDGHGTSGKEAAQSANDYISLFIEHQDKKIRSLTT
jgi:integrin-linked kinase-associated serine/threonine phosphatase 2C